jgi:hypothetical protein
MILGLFGVVVTNDTQAAWTDLFIRAAPLVAGLVGFFVTWWRRRHAIAPIAGGPADPTVIAHKQALEILHRG